MSIKETGSFITGHAHINKTPTEDILKDSLKVEDLKRYCDLLAEQREKVERVKDGLKIEQELLDKAEAILLAALEKAGLKTFKSPTGSFSVTNTQSVKVPSGEAKDAFFNYLKEKNMFEALATVHSKTLNSWYNEEVKKDAFFKVPGLEDPTSYQKIRFVKAK